MPGNRLTRSLTTSPTVEPSALHDRLAGGVRAEDGG